MRPFHSPLSIVPRTHNIWQTLSFLSVLTKSPHAGKQSLTLIGANKVFSAFSNGESWGLETRFLSDVEIQCDRVAYYPDI